MGYKIAIVGATGNVGREMLNILAEREFPVDEVYPIASRRSIGVEVSFGDKNLKCHDLETFDFSKCDFALMSAGGTISKEWSPKIGAAGCIVIDNSSAAPLRRLSETTQRLMPFSIVASSRIRETKVAKSPTHSTGVT